MKVRKEKKRCIHFALDVFSLNLSPTHAMLCHLVTKLEMGEVKTQDQETNSELECVHSQSMGISWGIQGLLTNINEAC